MRYIHQQQNWPHFHWDHALVMPLLAQARHQQGLLLGKTQALGLSERDITSLNALTLETVRSSQIEGDILNPELVRSSIAHRLNLNIAGIKPNHDKHIEGVVAMLLDATQGYAIPLTPERLLNWQILLFSGDKNSFHVRVGMWRDDQHGPMEVVSGPIGRERVHFEAPSADRLDNEMNQFIAWVNHEKTLDPLIKAAIAHLWFVTIHPLEDGNGRVARAITEYILAGAEKKALRFYSMSAQIMDERKSYYQVLEKTQKGSLDITSWVMWFLSCLMNAFEQSEKTISLCIDKKQFWEKYSQCAINERQKLMINKLFDGFKGKLTTKKWGILCKCSHDTALRDIQALLELGILIKDAGGGRSTSYSLRPSDHA